MVCAKIATEKISNDDCSSTVGSSKTSSRHIVKPLELFVGVDFETLSIKHFPPNVTLESDTSLKYLFDSANNLESDYHGGQTRSQRKCA